MAKSLLEYAAWLAGRDLIWPKPPERIAPKATPSIAPLEDIRAVTWDVYGTLLRIADGKLLHETPVEIRMQIALEKTIEEFKMWHSMSRKPGAPWEYMLDQYRNRMIELGMVARDKGDFPEIDSAEIWSTLIGRLLKKDYAYDVAFYGDVDELAERVAYFFHANMQGVAAAPHALETLVRIGQSRLKQGLLSDAQWFTSAQLMAALKQQGKVPDLWQIFDSDCMTLSCEEGLRKPSATLYETALSRFARLGIAAKHVLHVGCRQSDDLAAAKRAGMRTALYAGDKLSLRASKEELRDSATRPDRLITDLSQLSTILGLD